MSTLKSAQKAVTRYIGPLLEHLRWENGTLGKYTADEVFPSFSIEANKLANGFVDAAMPILKGKSKDVELVEALRRTGRPIVRGLLTDEQLKIADAYDMTMAITHAEHAADGPMIKDKGGFRPPVPVPGYVPDMVDPKIRRTLTSGNLEGSEIQKLKRDFEVFYLSKKPGASVKEIQDAFREQIEHQRGYDPRTKTPSFGPLRRPAGPGIPESWRMKPQKAMLAYLDRAAKDLAFNRKIERNPIMAKALGLLDDGRGNPYDSTAPVTLTGTGYRNFDTNEAVENIADDTALKGLWDYMNMTKAGYRSDVVEKISSLVNAGRIGPVSAVRDFLSAAAVVPGVVKASEIAIPFKALVKMISEPDALFKGGAMRKIRSVGSLINPDDAFSGFEAMADKLRTVQGRNALEMASRSWLYHIGQMLAPARAMAKDSKFFEKFNLPHWEQIPMSELKERVGIAMMEHAQGSYGPGGLPKWLLHGMSSDGSAALRTAFSLARWPMERMNRFAKVELGSLIKDKNPLPIMKTLLSGILGGEAMAMLKNAIPGQYSQEMTLPEWNRVREDTAYTITSKLATIGYAGMFAEMLHKAVQLKHGESVLGFKYPAFILTQDLGQRFADLYSALPTASNPIEVAHMLLDFKYMVLRDNVQLLRVLSNLSKEDLMQREKRIYERIHKGGGQAQRGSATFRNEFTKDIPFRDAKTMDEAMAALPQMLSLMEQTRQPKSLAGAFPTTPPDAPAFVPFVGQMQGREKGMAVERKLLKEQGLVEMKNALLLPKRRELEARRKLSTFKSYDGWSNPPSSGH